MPSRAVECFAQSLLGAPSSQVHGEGDGQHEGPGPLVWVKTPVGVGRAGNGPRALWEQPGVKSPESLSFSVGVCVSN